MITQRIDAHLARAKRATVSVGEHLGDGRSETPAVGFVQKINAYSRIYCSWDDYVPVESIVPSKIHNLFCVFNTAEYSYRFLNLLFCIVKSCFYEVLSPTTKSMNLDISYGLIKNRSQIIQKLRLRIGENNH